MTPCSNQTQCDKIPVTSNMSVAADHGNGVVFHFVVTGISILANL